MARAKGRFSALKSSVPGKAPLNTQIEFGEFAVNIADGTVYFKIIDPVDPVGNPDGQVISLSGSLPPTFLSLTDTPNDYTGQDGKMLVVDETNGVLTYADVPSGGGSSYQFGDGLDLNNATTPPTVNVVGGNGITVTPTSVNVNFGTTAGTVAEGNHTHNTDQITEGSTNLYFTNARADARVTFSALNNTGSVGTGATQVAVGNHTHTMDDLSDVSIGGIVQNQTVLYNGTNFVPVDFDFLSLIDTPASYNTKNGQFVRVDGTGSGLEFYDLSSNIVTSITAGNGLTSTGSTGDVTIDVGAGNGIVVAGNSISVNFGGNGGATTVSRSDHTHTINQLTDVDISGISVGQIIEWDGTKFIPGNKTSGGASTFDALTDTPASYTGESGRLVAVNAAENGLEFIDPPTAGVSSVTAGDGLVNSGTAADPVLDVGAGDGISIAADSVAVNFGGNGSATTVARSDHTHSNSIDDLTDVDTSTNAPSVGDILEWDGSNWVPATNSGSGSSYETIRVNYTALGSIDSVQDATSGITSAAINTPNIDFTFSRNGPPKSVLFYGYKNNVDGNGNSGYSLWIPVTDANMTAHVLSATPIDLPNVSPTTLSLQCDAGTTNADNGEHAFIMFLF